jgi:hypothetical protein
MAQAGNRNSARQRLNSVNRRAHRQGFGRRGVHCPKGKVIGTRRCSGTRALEIGVTRGAEQTTAGKCLPGRQQVTIRCSEVYAVGVDRQCQCQVIIDQQTRAELPT